MSVEIVPEELMRYAKVADAVYLIQSDRKQALGLLGEVNCSLIESSIQDATWGYGLQAMCVDYPKNSKEELIVAYRGTTSPADLVTDAGIATLLYSFTGDAIVRALVYRETKEKTWANYAVEKAAGHSLAAQLAGRLINALRYYGRTAEPMAGQYQKVTVVGHSLGGLIAAHVAYKHGHDGITFNTAPGVKYTLVASANECDSQRADRIINHRIVDDPVSGAPNLAGPNGYPCAHLGYIANWNPAHPPESLLERHQLNTMIETGFDLKYLVGGKAVPAPTTSTYW